MPDENLTPRISNIETLMQYMAQTQRELSSNQELLTTIVQQQAELIKQQAEEIQILRRTAQQHDETIGVYAMTNLAFFYNVF